MRNSRLAALALALLAPLVGEYLLGNISIRELAAVPFLVPMYGGGALLIRELARRTGRGWPTILLLGAAYGVVEPGIFDGSLFNPSFEGMDFTGASIPALGLSAYYLVQFAVNHAVWSITIPIALTEALTPRRRATPWLGIPGLVVTAAVYVLGGLIIRSDSLHRGEYHTSLAQGVGVVLGALVLVIIAFGVPRRVRGPVSTRRAPRPWLLGVAAFGTSTGYFFLPASWPGVAASLGIISTSAVLVCRLSRRAGWSQRHRLGLVGGALLTYSWAGFVLTAVKHHDDPVAFAGNGVLAIAAMVLLAVAVRRSAAAPADAPVAAVDSPAPPVTTSG